MQNLAHFISNLDPQRVSNYLSYWETIRPRTHADVFRRWIFAFVSIRTSWQQNVLGYQALTKDLDWIFDKDELDRRIRSTGLGLHDRRARALWELSRLYLEEPKQFLKGDEESWEDFRNRLVDKLYGIGRAKVAFALEMVYPGEAEVVCLDTHILRAMGWTESNVPGKTAYQNLEHLWLLMCKGAGYPSPMVRHIYWDKVQGKKNTRYWSRCLEEK